MCHFVACNVDQTSDIQTSFDCLFLVPSGGKMCRLWPVCVVGVGGGGWGVNYLGHQLTER